jgi:hypothetical protein
MIALLRLIPLSAWACIGLAAALGLQTVRVGWLKADVAELRLAIAEGAVQAERVTREAVEAARIAEREQAAKLAQQSEEAAAKARLAVSLAQRERDAALRKLSEVPADACLDSDIPADVRGLLRADNQNGAG